MEPVLYRSFLVHEMVRYVANQIDPRLDTASHESIAYVAQLDSLPDRLRARALAAEGAPVLSTYVAVSTMNLKTLGPRFAVGA